MHWSLLFLGLILAGCEGSREGEIQLAVRWPGWAEPHQFETADIRVSTLGGFAQTWNLPADQLSGFYIPDVPFPASKEDQVTIEVLIRTETQLWLRGKKRVWASDLSQEKPFVVTVILKRVNG